ncbi:hypothetical protein ACFL4F_00845 [Candidatus Margulisiibacteriota bacterium]
MSGFQVDTQVSEMIGANVSIQKGTTVPSGVAQFGAIWVGRCEFDESSKMSSSGEHTAPKSKMNVAIRTQRDNSGNIEGYMLTLTSRKAGKSTLNAKFAQKSVKELSKQADMRMTLISEEGDSEKMQVLIMPKPKKSLIDEAMKKEAAKGPRKSLIDEAAENAAKPWWKKL